MRTILFYLKNFFLPTEFNQNLPFSLRPKSLAIVVVLALIIKSFAFVSWFAFFEQPFFADIVSGLIVHLSNQERQSSGLSPLKESSILDKAAQDKALDMLAKNYFNHNAPDGTLPWYWFSKNGYAYKYAGENLAVDFFESEDVVKAWMNSPTHKFNIMNNKYQEIGVAVVKGSLQGRETTLVVQLFGTPKTVISQGPTPSPLISVSPVVSLGPSSSPVISKPPIVSVSPIVAGEITALPSPKSSPVLASPSSVASPNPSLIDATPSSSPVFAGLGTNPKLPLNPILAEKLIGISADPSPVMFSLVGYLALSLLLGVFSKIYTPQPKAVFGAGLAMLLIIAINYLPGVEMALNLTTRVL
ncbi:MAG: hypothetical protein A2418_01765 [Candidatus Brennerbacteria bacterium RIFOXYC1_FULL_41_11]|uniref:SCP domain-containing protein n=1 Tax=Candidatus Brennerbacteria bacterium RIFOXYD1_FULL_41_16 TaxID=1797529 RepID=A0A1G1XJA0_9BACT|nr:MAG: hypothetical protein A2391_03265 [Candidatus Brennerbacteria bacterium RIFOXYB1_FULL_41_13]OGY38966.1 MAG: hypothetical protein A2418_01765 [Candidatus Brennerbacteria bacterium RIFOXYC1_FULL_41_11]OGY40078.1 MAG: hypothetical protein A2570_01585 [Candidatus Brennerbacteria bacterium RIFOXYD1_FULL_41_16]